MSDQIKGIIEAVSAALCFGWMLFTEYRLQRSQEANELIRRKLADVNITNIVHAESDSALSLELQSDIGSSGTPSSTGSSTTTVK